MNLEDKFNDIDSGFVTPAKPPGIHPAEVKHKERAKPLNKLKPRSLLNEFSLANPVTGLPRIQRFPSSVAAFDFVHLFLSKHTIEVFLLCRGEETELKPCAANPDPLTGIYVRAILRNLPRDPKEVAYVDWLDRWTGELWEPTGDRAPELGQIHLGDEMFAWRIREQFDDHTMTTELDRRLEDLAIAAFLQPFPFASRGRPGYDMQSAHAPYKCYRIMADCKLPRKDFSYATALKDAFAAAPNLVDNEVPCRPPTGCALIRICDVCGWPEARNTLKGECGWCGTPADKREPIDMPVNAHTFSRPTTFQLCKSWTESSSREQKVVPICYTRIYKPHDVVKVISLHTLFFLN